MGKDIHEYRRQNGLADPNPAGPFCVAAKRGLTSIRSKRIIEWRIKRAMMEARYDDSTRRRSQASNPVASGD